MRIIVLSALVLGAMTSLALAEPAKPTAAPAGPIELTDTQMDAIVAGSQDGPPLAAEFGLAVAELAQGGEVIPPLPPHGISPPPGDDLPTE